MDFNCTECGNPFKRKPSENVSTKVFCSRSCSTRYHNRLSRSPKRKPEGTCESCGGPTCKRFVRCTDCRAAETLRKKEVTLEGVLARVSVQGKHPSWTRSHTQSLCRTWNAKLTSLPCQRCGYKVHVELCHITPVTKFPKETKLKVIHDPSNILVLCRNCHWEFDHRLLPLAAIPPRD